MPIHVLPDALASQIAAGEVVERPASVVKELVENSLDAGATKIQVMIEQAGKRLIEIVDDGAGIPADELPLAVQRHATSKLASRDDLFNIATLGFRGEALASIGSVARLTLTSKIVEEATGASLVVEGGAVQALQRVGAAQGTHIRVEDLFFNVPARLKFLKTDATERSHIESLLMRYAMAYPQIRWQVVMDGQKVLHTSGNGDQREVLAQLYGVDAARQMMDVLFYEDDIKVTGFISPVGLTRANRNELTVFINGRWVKDMAINAAIMRAYHTLLMVGRYPIAVLFITLPTHLVDVNVHPAKAEVRFRESDVVFSGVQRAVKRALLAYTAVPEIPVQKLWGQSAAQPQIDPAWEMSAQVNASGSDAIEQPQEADQAGNVAQISLHGRGNPDALPLLRLIGQVALTYLVAEGPDGLYLIDQHAAHERILFEKLMASHEVRQNQSQHLLQPQTVQLSATQAADLENQLAVMTHLGFTVEAFGPNTFIVRAIPTLLSKGDPKAALLAVVEQFEEDETPLQKEREERIAARVCKRMAIKAGQVLREDEQRALLADLEQCQSPRTCPHGRPTMIHLSADLLERQFGRRGAR